MADREEVTEGIAGILYRDDCPNNPPGPHGMDGAQGGKGGDGGNVVVTASGIVECSLGSTGGYGDQGGTGSNGQSPFWSDGAWGTPGNGGDGGAGGNGGSIKVCTADTANPDIEIDVAGGSGGDGGDPGDGEGATTGTPGASGPNGIAGSETLTEMTEDLIATLSVDKTATRPDHQVSYTIGVSSATAQTNVNVSLPIPANTTFVSATAGYNQQAGTVSWDISSLAACKFRLFTLTVLVDAKAPDGTIISNTGTVSSDTEGPVLSNAVNTKVLVIDPVPPTSEESQLGNSKDTPYVGDPVNPAIGNYFYTKTLLGLPAKSLPVTLKAIYNSRDNTIAAPWVSAGPILITLSWSNQAPRYP